MHSRSRVVAVLAAVLVALVFSVGAVGTVAGDHGEQTDEGDLIEVQTVTADGTDTGELRVTYSYHIGDDVASLDVTFTSGEDPVGTDGFDSTDDSDTYEWDEQTDSPEFEFTVDANQTDHRHDGLLTADTGEWAMIGTNALPRTDLRYASMDPENIATDRITTVPDGEGVAADSLVYLGEYDRHTFDGGTEVIVSDHADPDVSAEELGAILEDSSDQLDVGADDEVTAFVATSPLRRGGVAIGSDFWIHDAALPPEPVFWHEFVHTQQVYNHTPETEWTFEGGADYYSYVLAMKQGEFEYHQFYERLDRGHTHDDVVLADRESWQGSTADYELGALTLAALDETIRDGSDATFEDVFKEKNEYDDDILDATFESLASETTGTDLDEFFETYVRSTPPEIDIPSPLIYDGPNTDADLALDVDDSEFDSGGANELTVEITNTGTETSLAPTLLAESAADVSVDVQRADDTRVTELDESWVLDNLEPGESHSLTLDTETDDDAALELSAEDMSEQGDSTTLTVDDRPTLDVTLDVPEDIVEGEEVELTAETNFEADDIEGYEFAISGPDGDDTIESDDSTIAYTFEDAGPYLVAVSAESVDGQADSMSVSLTVEEDGTSGEQTDDQQIDQSQEDTPDDGQTGDGVTDDGQQDDTETQQDDSEEEPQHDDEDQTADDDMFGPGFGILAVTGAVFIFTLVASRRAKSEEI